MKSTQKLLKDLGPDAGVGELPSLEDNLLWAEAQLGSSSHPDVMKSFVDNSKRITTQSEIYRGIFDNYGGTNGEIFDNYRGHYLGEV